jgi:candidapepsin
VLFSPESLYTMPLSTANTVLLLAALTRGAWATGKTPEGAIVLPLTYNELTAAYYAPFEVGTPPQTEYLKIDTGSPTISFLDPQSSFCKQANNPCMTYGTFDNQTSSYVLNRTRFLLVYVTDAARCSTCVYQGLGFTDELIDFGSGVYLEDTITLRGVTTDNVNFGYLTSYGNPSGMLIPAATIAGKPYQVSML